MYYRGFMPKTICPVCGGMHPPGQCPMMMYPPMPMPPVPMPPAGGMAPGMQEYMIKCEQMLQHILTDVEQIERMVKQILAQTAKG